MFDSARLAAERAGEGESELGREERALGQEPSRVQKVGEAEGVGHGKCENLSLTESDGKKTLCSRSSASFVAHHFTS